jgi:hypothetical protein
MKAFFWNNEWIWGIVFYTVGEEQQEKGDAAVENQVHIGKPQTLRAHGPWAVTVADMGCGIRGAKTTEMLICTKI